MAKEYFTSFWVDYHFDDLDARYDIATSSFDNWDPNRSSEDVFAGTDMVDFMTQEHNLTILDGSFRIYDDDEIGLVSEYKANSQGLFPNGNPKITVTFSSLHKSFAIGLNCIKDSPTKVKIDWYRDNTRIATITSAVDPNKADNYVANSVRDFNKVVIEILSALPDRYVKINKVDFGTSIKWDDSKIKDATLAKAIARNDDKISMDNLTFTVVDTIYGVNLANPIGFHSLFEQNQKVEAYEYVNGSKLVLGTFYLDNFTTEGNAAKVTATTLMGLLDKEVFNGGGPYNNANFIDVVREVIPNRYVSVSPALENVKINGFLLPGTIRSTLGKLLFAVGGVVDCTSNIISITPINDSYAIPITRENKVSTKTAQTDVITGVKLKNTRYIATNDRQDLLTDTFDTGVHTVYFKEPGYLYGIGGSSAQYLTSTAFSITFEVFEDDTEVTVQANKYNKVEQSYIKYVGDVDNSNVKEFSTTVCNNALAQRVLRRLVDYYKNTITITVQHYASDIALNSAAFVQNNVASLNGYVGLFEKRTFNLTGGFLDTAVLRGYQDISDKYSYAGTDSETSQVDIYAGEQWETWPS